MRMAVADGVKRTRTLKANPVYKNISILAANGHSRGLTRERCLALGCDDFISKPFALPELEMRLTNILSVERLKTIKATGPMNLAPNRRERSSRGAGRRRVA
jgi:CheY-like chemotaxis protein